MGMHEIVSVVVSAAVAACAVAEISVTKTITRQNWPWSPEISVDYVVSGSGGSVSELAVDAYAGEEWICRIPKGELSGPVTPRGDRAGRLTFDPTRIPALKARGVIPRFRVALTAKALDQSDVLYMIVDLASAENGTCSVNYVTGQALTNGEWGAWSSNPVTTNGVPPVETVVWTGVTNDVRYATTQLVLRRIPAGPFPMGCKSGEPGGLATREFGQKTVTLSADYYMAVFELTQGQWFNVMGAWPACNFTDDAACRPVENVTFNSLRGAYPASGGGSYDWPTGRDVDPASFFGRLNAKTGLRFDLPTESRWEKACRAGVETSIYNGFSNNLAALKKVGRASENAKEAPYADQHVPVGRYEPNGYGLYDMLGNIREMCLDGFWQTSSGAPAVYVPGDDDEGPAVAYPAGGRVCKGGHYGAGYQSLRCGARSWISATTNEKSRFDGFRVCLSAE